MLYIFDLGNVIVDIDFNRVLGTWSDLTRIPLATLQQHFTMGEAFHQHERGEISDEDFAAAMCHEMNMSLSYEQFSHGWQAVFVACARRLSRLCKNYASRGIAWWFCPIPTVCIPLSGRMNTRR
jgi:putative hydrolase of the HAD superfamily